MRAREPGPAGRLAAEWERVELLGHLLAEARRGEEPEESRLARLRDLQDRVGRIRDGDEAWRALGAEELGSLGCDVLACALAPEAEPRVGVLFQHLQPGTPQPYPTPALIQELLALDAGAAPDLYRALAPDRPLRKRGLVRMEGEEPFEPIRPGRRVSARLLGRPETVEAPPGSVPVPARPAWDELVLPESRLRALREFLLYLRHRDTVESEWGGDAVGGPVALFSGPSGTGKTFAAAVVATEVGWPLYRVDLGRLVSKYIGETEKNLNRLFDAAHGRPMVLQFDEADSVFGRRGQVREARDRYANLEVSHLLARIELHRGPCILTTNMRRELDPAFTRRFQVVVDFPRPDAEARTRLWERLLPPGAPTGEGVDPGHLGPAVHLSGGEIRNAAVHAAYLAAGDGGAITLSHLAVSVWRELAKGGREVTEGDLGPLASRLPEEMPC